MSRNTMAHRAGECTFVHVPGEEFHPCVECNAYAPCPSLYMPSTWHPRRIVPLPGQLPLRLCGDHALGARNDAP